MNSSVVSINDQPFFIRDRVAALLFNAEQNMIRGDERVGSSSLSEAIRKMLLRIEGLASMSIAGYKVSASSLLRLEAALDLFPIYGKSLEIFTSFIDRIALDDKEGVSKAMFYPRKTSRFFPEQTVLLP